MIHRISSSLTSFKELRFRSGFNLVVSEKSPNANDLQTRNSSGKSSLIEIVHFLLGASCTKGSIFRRISIIDSTFEMEFDLRGLKVEATRSGKNHNRIEVSDSAAQWPVQPKVDKIEGQMYFSVKEWCRVLGAEMFGIDDQMDSKYSPSFRSLIPYFVRREADGGFLDPVLYYANQQAWNQQVNLSYILGLEWQVPQAVQEVRLQEQSLKNLKREAKVGLLGDLVGSVGELRSRLTVLDQDVTQMKGQLAQFQVLPEYADLEREASLIAVELSDMANRNALDQRRIEAIERQLNNENSHGMPNLEQMYSEVGVIFPDIIKKNLDDVKLFYETVLRNRRQHLAGEISAAKTRIESRRQDAQDKDLRRIEIIGILSSHGALDQLNLIRGELSRKQAEAEDVRKRLDMAKQIASKGTDLTIQRAHLRQRLSQDHDDHNNVLNDAVVMFGEFSRRISDHHGTLTVEATDNGPKFEILVDGKAGKGVRNMQTFCFDLTLTVLLQRRGRGPGFLMHDSHLFDGMDSRQVAHVIELGAAQAAINGFQYIVTLNSDQLESAEFSNGFDVEEYRNPVQLTDRYETGGLFGMKI